MIRRCVLTMMITLAIGCMNSHEPSGKELAKRQWNAARAGVLFSLAKGQFEAGNLDACRKSVDDALVLDPQNIQVHLLSARLSIEQGQLEAAQKELQACRAMAEQAEAAAMQRSSRGGARAASNAAAVSSARALGAEAAYYSGVIQQRWQRPQGALEAYANAYELNPGELSYLLARAEMLVALDKHAEALALLREKLTYFENSPAIRDAVGQLLAQDGKYEEAVALLRQASILASDDLMIREHLALALFYAGEYREAAQVTERLLKEQSHASRADLMVLLGECQMLANQPREARETFQAAAQLQPAAPGVWVALAKTGLKLGDLPRAEQSIRRAQALEPSNGEAWLLLGYLRLRQEKLDEAITAFRMASTLDPNDPTSLCMCGYVLEKQGRSSEALECYGKALKLNPDDELASMLMSQMKAQE